MSSGNAPIDTLIVCIEEQIARMKEEKARLEEEKAHIEEEIHQQTAFLSSLRAKRINSLLPVFRLPPEMLATIFIHGARDYHKNGPASFTSCIPSWVNVSYVCSHWRNIALNCPTLWTYHTYRLHVSQRWTEELFLRSKQALLKISCLYPYHRPPKEYSHWWSSLMDDLLKHSERIQDFRLRLPPEFLPAKLSLCAPRLENLSIQLYREPERSLAITDADTPILRTLTLVRCPLPWYSLNLSRLNTLSLLCAPVQLNMEDFLAILSGMQDLTLLDLEYALPSARGFLSSGGLGNSPKINLPRLALLVVTAPLSTVVALLSCVNIPSKTQLKLEPLLERGSSIGDYAPISSFLAQRFSISERLSSSCPIFRSLVIDGYNGELTFSSLERDCPPRTSLKERLGPNIPLKITFGEEDEESEELTESDKHRIMSDICCSLPLTNVQTLHVTEPEFPSAIWKEILGHLDGLRYMKLSDGCMPDLSMLSLTAKEPKENPGGKSTHDQDRTLGHILAPALEELELVCISFISDDATPGRARMSQKSLFDTLSTRKGLRDRLTMIECEIEVNQIDDGSP